VSKVTSRVWVVAGLLSGLAGVLAAMSTAGGNSIGVNANVLVPVLFVAVVARMTNLPLAVIGALAAGILQQATSWAFGSGVPLDGAWVLIICALLLLQRDRVSRAEIEQASTWQATRETRPTPRELRVLPTVKKWYRTGIVIAAIVALGYPWAMSPSQTSLGTITMIDAIVGLSLLVLTGWAGQISLGQFAFAAVGGYVAAVLHVPFFLAVLLGATAGAVMAVLVGIPALRLRGLHLAITSLAFAVATSAVLLNPTYLGKHLPRNLSRPVVLGLSFEDQRTFYYFTLIALVAVVLAVLGLRQSRTARVLIAARDNDRAAQSFGINIVRARLVAFAVSGFMAAFAGALYAFQQSGVKPDAFSADQSLTLFLMAVIGGLGSVAGPIIGALYLGLQTTFGATPQFQQFFTGFAPLALLLLVPGGLGKLAFDIRDAGLRRVASRNHIDAPSLTADGQPRHGDGQAPILPKARTGGGRAYVARRYEVDGQWAIDVTDSIVSAGAVATEQAEAADDGDGTFRGVVDGNEPAAAEVAP
jgi:branched-chain amino acid transport system permease protein